MVILHTLPTLLNLPKSVLSALTVDWPGIFRQSVLPISDLYVLPVHAVQVPVVPPKPAVHTE